MCLIMSLVWSALWAVEPAGPGNGPTVQSQPAPQQESGKVEYAGRGETVLRVIALQHVLADRVVGALQEIGYGSAAAAPSGNALVVRGSPQDVAAIEELVRSMDVPGEKKQPSAEIVKKMISLSHARARELAELLSQVSVRALQCGVDVRTNSLVVVGTAEDVESAAQLARELDRPASAMGDRGAGGHGALKLEFIFLRGSLKSAKGDGGGDKLPESLQGVAEALADNGFYDLQMMAPIHLVADPAARFEQRTRIGLENEPGELVVSVRGAANYGLEGTVDVSIDTEVTGSFGRADRPAVSTSMVFKLQTTLATRLGDYLVVAAAPASNPWSDGLVLVVRATAEASRD